VLGVEDTDIDGFDILQRIDNGALQALDIFFWQRFRSWGQA